MAHGAQPNAWGPAGEGLRMAVRLDRPARAGRRVVLWVTLQNAESSKPVTVARTDPVRDYAVRVRGPDGQELPLTPAAALRLAGGAGHRRIATALALGESCQDAYPLSEAFALTRPGRHEVEVSRRLDDGALLVAPTLLLDLAG